MARVDAIMEVGGIEESVTVSGQSPVVDMTSTSTSVAFTNLREVLRAGGMDFGDVVSVTAFITDFTEFDAYNKVYREFFPRDPPARATVGATALNLGAKIELQMIPAKPRW